GLLGGRDFANETHRQKVADIMGIDVHRIPSENSWAYHEILEGILRGKIKGLWVICTNPAHSWINQNQARDILDRLDFLVVQDMYHSTETAVRADLVLPAAGWGEKDGTFINSERRLAVHKKVHKAPGQALADFQIFKLIAHYWGCGDMFRRWTDPASVFEILKELTAGQPCDITGIDGYAHIERQGGIQWPYPKQERNEGQRIEEQAERTERRLFEDGRFFHSNGRAKLLFEEPRPLPELPSDKFPFLLLTGRGSASQWHTQTRTSKSAVLRKLYPEHPFVEINPTDARNLGIKPNHWVTVESQRGELKALALLTNAVNSKTVFIPMHYAETNRLTDPVFDPYSKQPAYKSCAVRVTPL
ncbi:MAG: molybdopterin oxidoreductase family protein, partial [Planctomycetes bacterium]|nr:molybdopterin oxidoreductase family protein [Planctomycetota bacterium]